MNQYIKEQAQNILDACENDVPKLELENLVIAIDDFLKVTEGQAEPTLTRQAKAVLSSKNTFYKNKYKF